MFLLSVTGYESNRYLSFLKTVLPRVNQINK